MVSASKAGVASMAVLVGVPPAAGSVACGVDTPAVASSVFAAPLVLVSVSAVEGLDVFSLFSNLGAVGGFVLAAPAFFRRDGVLLGGLLASTLSWALMAELAVGRIMRARKPSSGLVTGREDSGFLAWPEGGRTVDGLVAGLELLIEGRAVL